MARQPGEVGIKTLTRTANYLRRRGSSTTSTNFTFVSHWNSRPSYEKGRVITFPSGDTFIRSTAYSISDWEVGNAPAARAKFRLNNLDYDITDSGSDGQLILAGYPRAYREIPRDAQNEAITKALNKLADQKVNVGENLATFGQTLRLFAAKTNILVAALKAARNRKEWQKYLNKSARDLGREGRVERYARLYIEYVYGLKPLVQDVYTAHQMLTEAARPTFLLSAHAKASRQSGHPSSFLSGTRADVTRTNHSADITVKASLWARIDPEYGGIRAVNQLGLINPAALAWELVPWSFVVDWVLPIGPVLYALSARAGLIFVDGSLSMRQRETYVANYSIDCGAANSFAEKRDAQYPVWFNHYERIPIRSWPLPGLWVDFDPLRGDRSFKALALAILNLGKDKDSSIKYGRL